MLIKTFSNKQMEVLAFALDDRPILVADGAVRSGKTVVFSMGFVMWAMENYDQSNFIIAGKTVTSTERNVIRTIQTIDNFPYDTRYVRSDREHIVTGKQIGRAHV